MRKKRFALISLIASSIFLSSCGFSLSSLFSFLPTPEDNQMAQKAQQAWNNPNIDLSSVKHKLGPVYQCYQDAAQISGIDLSFLLAFTYNETTFDPNSMCCNHPHQRRRHIVCRCDVSQGDIESIDCGLIQTNSLTLCGIIRACSSGSRACRSEELFQKANSYSTLSMVTNRCDHLSLSENLEYCNMLKGGTNKQCASVYTGAYELLDCEKYVDYYNEHIKGSPPPPKSSSEYWREVAICYNGGTTNLISYLRFGNAYYATMLYAKKLLLIMDGLKDKLSHYFHKLGGSL